MYTLAGGGGGGGGEMYLHTAMNSWKVYYIHIYSRVDAVIQKGVHVETWKMMTDTCPKGTHGSSGLFRVHGRQSLAHYKRFKNIVSNSLFIPVYRRANGVAQQLPH